MSPPPASHRLSLSLLPLTACVSLPSPSQWLSLCAGADKCSRTGLCQGHPCLFPTTTYGHFPCSQQPLALLCVAHCIGPSLPHHHLSPHYCPALCMSCLSTHYNDRGVNVHLAIDAEYNVIIPVITHTNRHTYILYTRDRECQTLWTARVELLWEWMNTFLHGKQLRHSWPV